MPDCDRQNLKTARNKSVASATGMI